MSDPTVTRGMSRDLDALARADERFRAAHGAEARRRWEGLGAAAGEELWELQLDAIERRGPTRQIWDALAWELGLRIDLVERARIELRDEEETGAS